MTISKFLSPKNDFAFKKLFGTERNKDILIHFLNDMLTFRDGGPIVDVTFLKTIQEPDIAANKTSIVDILCRDDKGAQYIVEMQVAREKGFIQRAQFYAAKAYVDQMCVGGVYEHLKEVIFLAIVDYTMFPKKSDYKSDHSILDLKTQERDLRGFSFTFLDLTKFHKSVDELDTNIDKWMYFLKNAEVTQENDVLKLAGTDAFIQRAYVQLEKTCWSDEELRTYDQQEKYAWAHRGVMDQKFDEGLEKGLKEGEKKGREEGERKKALDIARKLLAQQMDPITITTITGLSIEEIKVHDTTI